MATTREKKKGTQLVSRPQDPLGDLSTIVYDAVATVDPLEKKRGRGSFQGLKAISRSEQPPLALPETVRQQIAGLYFRAASQNPQGSAQSAFNQARGN